MSTSRSSRLVASVFPTIVGVSPAVIDMANCAASRPSGLVRDRVCRQRLLLCLCRCQHQRWHCPRTRLVSHEIRTGTCHHLRGSRGILSFGTSHMPCGPSSISRDDDDAFLIYGILDGVLGAAGIPCVHSSAPGSAPSAHAYAHAD